MTTDSQIWPDGRHGGARPYFTVSYFQRDGRRPQVGHTPHLRTGRTIYFTAFFRT